MIRSLKSFQKVSMKDNMLKIKKGRHQMSPFFIITSYGFVDQSPDSLTNTLLFSLSCAMINSARSSGCITLSGFPSVSFKSMAMSLATVLGSSVETLMLSYALLASMIQTYRSAQILMHYRHLLQRLRFYPPSTKC